MSTTNLHTGFTIGFSTIVTSQLENSFELGKLNESDISWIGNINIFMAKKVVSYDCFVEENKNL